MRRSIIWFRNDLRIHDNEALVDAVSHNDELIPLYVIDPRLWRENTSYGFRKMGRYRMQFVLESLQDLRSNLRARGSELYIVEGFPEEVIPRLANETNTSFIYCNRERTRDEVQVQDRLEKKLWAIGQELRYYRGKMLYYTADLPFPVTHCPDTFTAFRKEVEKYVPIRAPFDSPRNIPKCSSEILLGDIPDIKEFGFEPYNSPDRIKGGESEALKQLQYYLFDTDLILNYKETRNDLLGRDYSSKFSAHLSKGTLSPKMVYSEIKKYESERQKNKSTYCLIFELLWRDFFRFMAKKHGNKIFLQTGIKGRKDIKLNDDRDLFEKWTKGETGIPFVDSNMKELNQTGFMSNRGRQNVASFLVNDLLVNWVWGAEYFESLLIDYDPCSNYGNWNYIAKVGSDPREDRYFNISTQARKYDPNGTYIKTWLPTLKPITSDFIFNPYSDPESRPKSYPVPCISKINW